MNKKVLSALFLAVGLVSAVLFMFFRHTMPLSVTVVLKVIPTLMMLAWIATMKLDRHNALIFVGRITSYNVCYTKLLRRGFRRRFAEVLVRLDSGELSRRKAAKELGVGYATLKRLLDAGYGRESAAGVAD